MKNKEYFYEFDFMRAITMILVVLGHSFIGGGMGNNFIEYTIKFIYSFHMPVFFFISGFFSIKIFNTINFKDKKDFIKKKFVRLGIPYICITLLAIPIKLSTNLFVKRPIILNSLIVDVLFYPKKNPVASLWFIYVLFMIFLWSLFINKLALKKIIVINFFLMIIILSFNIQVFGLDLIFKNILFFYFGVIIRKNYSLIIQFITNNRLKLIYINIFTLIIINLIFYPDHILLKQLMYLITGTVGILLIMSFSTFNFKSKLLNTLSSYSYDIYLLSWFTQNCIGYFIYKLLNINYFLVIFITFISGFLVIIPSKYILRKNKFLSRILLGKIYK
ncbi:acyltransferase family protein [Clostridium perfringens]